MDTRVVPKEIYLKHEEEWRMIRKSSDGHETAKAGSTVAKAETKPPSAPQSCSN